MEDASSNGTFDPTRRRLCPDGACVGIVGPDGRCGECGRTEAQAALGEERAGAPEGAAPEGEVDVGATEAAAGAQGVATSGGFDPRRRLCDDGACVGVVGDDGTCRVCGRRAE